ncbi:MAG: hypothetical protein ACLFVU_07425 [Phycisphaerae bacterium]
MSPVVIGDVLVMTHGEGDLTAVDPKTGDLLWTLADVVGVNQVPAKYTQGGAEYIVVAGEESGKLTLLEPNDFMYESDRAREQLSRGSLFARLCTLDILKCK